MKKRDVISKLKKLENLPLPDKDKILKACENEPVLIKKRSKAINIHPFNRKLAVLVIATSLLIVSGISVTAADAIEYGRATDFFDQHNISYEGLTRSETKKVYRDISSEKFEFYKTGDVITKNLKGYEITPSEMTSADISRLWLVNYRLKPLRGLDVNAKVCDYRVSHAMADYDNTESSFYYDELTQYSNNAKTWTKRFDNYYIESFCAVGEKVLVAGNSSSDGSIYNGSVVGVYMINADSSVEWYREYDTKMIDTQVDYVLYNNDSYVMFIVTRCYLSITEIDAKGNVISDESIKFDSAGGKIMQVAKIDDGYLFLKDNKLLQIKDGKISKAVSYYSSDGMYEINDMIAYNGLVYLSGRVVSTTGREKIGLLDKYENVFGSEQATDEELLEFFKNNHKAVLLVCDPQNAKAITFYSLAGGEGSSLNIDKGKLIWNVNRYTAACLYKGDISTLYASSGRFASIESDVWNYVFNSCGQLISEGGTEFKTICEG